MTIIASSLNMLLYIYSLLALSLRKWSVIAAYHWRAPTRNNRLLGVFVYSKSVVYNVVMNVNRILSR
jgi:hypothetical protein